MVVIGTIRFVVIILIRMPFKCRCAVLEVTVVGGWYSDRPCFFFTQLQIESYSYMYLYHTCQFLVLVLDKLRLVRVSVQTTTPNEGRMLTK